MSVDRPHLSRRTFVKGLGATFTALQLNIPRVSTSNASISSPEAAPEAERPILPIGRQDHQVVTGSNFQEVDLGVTSIHILTAPHIGLALVALLDPQKGARAPYENGYTGDIDVQDFTYPSFEPNLSRSSARIPHLSPEDYEGYLDGAVRFVGRSLNQDMDQVPHLATLLANRCGVEPQVIVFKPGAVLINGVESRVAIIRTQLIFDPAS